MSVIRAISVREPFAELIMVGKKEIRVSKHSD